MKRLTVIICLFVCASASGQKIPDARASASLEISSIILHRDIKISFGHSFKDRWSAEGGASIQIPASSDMTEQEKEHESFLSGEEDRTIGILHPEFRIGLKYWPRRFMEGPYIGTGCSYDMKSGADMTAGLGYTARFMKHLGMSVGYEIRIIDSIGKGTFNTKGIRLEINYIF